MNFWPRYVGDIQRKTGHLSLAEMGAYDRLLDHLYATEEPLPGSVADCCRIARAMDKHERAAVDSVLRQFFTLTDGGYINGRASQEIAKAQPKIEAARLNGRTGGRPRKNPQGTDEKPTGFPTGTHDEPNSKALQNQIQNSLHVPSEPVERARKRAARQCPPDFAVTSDLAAWAAEKVPAVDVAAETEKFRDYTFPRAIGDWPGAWRNWMRKAAEMRPRGVVVQHPASKAERVMAGNIAAAREFLASTGEA